MCINILFPFEVVNNLYILLNRMQNNQFLVKLLLVYMLNLIVIYLILFTCLLTNVVC